MASEPLIPSFWAHYLFSETASKASMTKAAVPAGVSQSAVSQAMTSLSAYYGVELLSRDANSVVPTTAGQILHARVQASISLLKDGFKDPLRMDKRTFVHFLRQYSARRREAMIQVVRLGSFTAAAKSLGIAVPTLHRASRELEGILSTALFERTSHGISPTKRSIMFAAQTSLALAELRQAKSEIDLLDGKTSGCITIGAMPLARSHLVPISVDAFKRAYPQYHISILEAPYEDLVVGLKRGDVDVLIGALRGNTKDDDLFEEFLFDDPLAIIMRPGHPLVNKSKLTKTDIVTFPWIAPRLNTPLRGQFEKMLGAQSVSDIVECGSLTVSRVLLSQSDRLMLLSDSQILYELSTGTLVSRRLPGGQVQRSIGMTMRANWRPTDTQLELLGFIRQQASDQ